MALTPCFWLDTPNGRVMIGAWAVLVGRSPDCNIVLEGAEFSRHHLLVRLGQSGAELLPLGRQPVRVNGAECRGLTVLAAGDRIEVGEWAFRVGQGQVEDGTGTGAPAWFLERRAGVLQLVTGPVFRVGGGGADDLIVASWEPTVFSLTPNAKAMTLTALRPGVSCGRFLAVDEDVALQDGACISYGGEAFVLRAKPTHASAETLRAEVPRFAVVVLLEFMPRGGQLTVEIGGRLVTTLLSERRCDLVACLLQPPPPYHPGDFIPEELLCDRVWPGEQNGRTELNSLLYRLRQSLADEGIDPAPLLERRGGGLRFRLAPRARVVVR